MLPRDGRAAAADRGHARRHLLARSCCPGGDARPASAWASRWCPATIAAMQGVPRDAERARLRAAQHLAADRRRARAGGAEHDRRRRTRAASSAPAPACSALTDGFRLAFTVGARVRAGGRDRRAAFLRAVRPGAAVSRRSQATRRPSRGRDARRLARRRSARAGTRSRRWRADPQRRDLLLYRRRVGTSWRCCSSTRAARSGRGGTPGAWSIPKGEYEPGRGSAGRGAARVRRGARHRRRRTARRSTSGEIRQRSGKRVRAWAHRRRARRRADLVATRSRSSGRRARAGRSRVPGGRPRRVVRARRSAREKTDPRPGRAARPADGVAGRAMSAASTRSARPPTTPGTCGRATGSRTRQLCIARGAAAVRVAARRR